MFSSRGCGNVGKSALRLFHISTTCVFCQGLREFRDGGPEGRVSSDAIVVAFDIVECGGGGRYDRVSIFYKRPDRSPYDKIARNPGLSRLIFGQLSDKMRRIS